MSKTVKFELLNWPGVGMRITEIFNHSKHEIINFSRNEWTGPGTTRNWLKINNSESLNQVIYRDHTLSLHELKVNDVFEIGFDQIYPKNEFDKMERQTLCGIIKKITDEDMTVEVYKNVETAINNRKTIKPKTMIKKFSKEKNGRVLWSNFSSTDPKKLIITHSSIAIGKSPEWEIENCELTWMKINGSESYSSKSFEPKIDFDDVKEGDVVQVGKDLVAGCYRRLRIDRSEVVGVVKSIKAGDFVLILYTTLEEAMKAASKETI